jgi:hypothetical protein
VALDKTNSKPQSRAPGLGTNKRNIGAYPSRHPHNQPLALIFCTTSR